MEKRGIMTNLNGYGVSTCIAGSRPRGEALEAIASAGFRTVELVGDPDHLDAWTADPDGLRRELHRLGLTPLSVHIASAAWDISNLDPELREAAVQAGIRSLQQAAAVGAQVVICHPNAQGPDYAAYTPEDVAASLARTRGALERFAEEAARLGLQLALENLPSRNTYRPATTMAGVLGLIDGLGDHVGLCQDVGHTNANHLDLVADYLAANGRIVALHLQDNDGQGADQHLLPGEGTADWAAFVPVLRDTQYRGLRTFEIREMDDLPGALAALARIADAWNDGKIL